MTGTRELVNKRQNRIEARGATQDEAWHNAVLQAEAMGMAGLDLSRIAESMGCL
jgi:hypothetical protein